MNFGSEVTSKVPLYLVKMKLIIDSERLKNILSQKEKHFTTSYAEPLSIMFTSFAFFLTLFCSEYKGIWFISAEYVKFLVIGMSVSFFSYGLYLLYKKRANSFTSEALYGEIHMLNEVNGNIFSIVAIHCKKSNKYLLFYDEKWKCNLFPNYKVRGLGEEKELNNLKTLLSHDLNVKANKIELTYKFQRESTKISQPTQVEKLYVFHIYYAEIKDSKLENCDSSFEINNKTYSWKSISEMEQDDAIKRINMDVVGFIKDNLTPTL